MDSCGSDLRSGNRTVVAVIWGLLVALCAATLVWLFRWPSRRSRETVMSCLSTGAKLGREIPLRGAKYAVLSRMEEDGEIVGRDTPDGRMYRLSARSEAARRVSGRGTPGPGAR